MDTRFGIVRRGCARLFDAAADSPRYDPVPRRRAAWRFPGPNATGERVSSTHGSLRTRVRRCGSVVQQSGPWSEDEQHITGDIGYAAWQYRSVTTKPTSQVRFGAHDAGYCRVHASRCPKTERATTSATSCLQMSTAKCGRFADNRQCFPSGPAGRGRGSARDGAG